jgi:hypothetical protein
MLVEVAGPIGLHRAVHHAIGGVPEGSFLLGAGDGITSGQ